MVVNEGDNARYVYKPLICDRQIRLLHLLPGQGSDDIICGIDYVNLDIAPDFAALSYPWGDASFETDIRFADGTRLSVRKNLYGALRAIRHEDRGRVVWVDRVCINQDDCHEKRKQICMMSDIYRRAEKVVAWVGEEDSKDQAALHVERYLHLSSEDRPSTGELEAWVSLAIFIKRPWFSRVWIVQELAVAKQLLIYCGRKKLEWDILRRALIKFVCRMGLFLSTSKADVVLERVFTLVSIRNLVTENSNEQDEYSQCHLYGYRFSRIDDDRALKKVQAGDLLHFVKGTRLFESSEPKDHIYALLGLVLKDEREGIEITYSDDISHCDVYREFVRVMIIQHGTLDVLSQAAELNDSLPSWVPNWTLPMKSYPLATQKYSASGNTTASGVDFSVSALTLHGVVIDSIKSLTPGFMVSDTADSQAFEPRFLMFLQVLLSVATIAKGRSSGRALKAIFGALKANPSSARTRPVRITSELEEQWHQLLVRSCKGAHSRGRGLESAYVQTLFGDLPFKQLEGSSQENLVGECYLIWKERLKYGLLKTGPHQVSPQLMDLFPKHQDCWLSEAIERMKKQVDQLVSLFVGVFRQQFHNTKESKKNYVDHMTTAVKLKDYLKSILCDLYPVSGTAELGRHRSSCLTRYHDNESIKWGIARMFSRAVERMARNRHFCITSLKGFMGWVPFEAQIGDLVCLLEGGRVPFILRPEVGGKGRYRFVGEAYIHGLMRGEGLDVGEMKEISLV